MHADWIKSQLWDENYFRPDRLGVKQPIYTIEWRGPLVSLLLDPVTGSPPWNRRRDQGFAESFFDGLKPFVGQYGASWFYVTDPDDAVSLFMWEQPADEQTCSSKRLWCFDRQPADQGGAQHLGLLFNDRRGLIVIDRAQCFEIAFYGSPDRWLQIAEALGLSTR